MQTIKLDRYIPSFSTLLSDYYYFIMSYNTEMQNTENTDEWINWIDEAINKEHINYYEYSQFSNFQQSGAGSFGKVYRANWKNLEKHFALKSFFNLDNVTMKEIVREVIFLMYNILYIFIYFLIFNWVVFQKKIFLNLLLVKNST